MRRTTKPTPMMERYNAVKQAHPGTLLLFHMGDFYETFHDDAVTASRLLGLTLTTRGNGSSDAVPMAGFPASQLEGNLLKLIRAGQRTAICEQVTDPRKATGMVWRETKTVISGPKKQAELF